MPALHDAASTRACLISGAAPGWIDEVPKVQRSCSRYFFEYLHICSLSVHALKRAYKWRRRPLSEQPSALSFPLMHSRVMQGA